MMSQSKPTHPHGTAAAALAGLLLALAGPALAQDQPPAEAGQPAPELAAPTQYGDWYTRCEATSETDATPRCIAYQTLTSGTDEPVLQFVVSKPPELDTPAAVLILPLGIFLLPGVTIQIDDGPVTELPVERCLAIGCRIQFPLNETSLSTLEHGTQAMITFVDPDRHKLSAPVSLNGFAEAFAALP